MISNLVYEAMEDLAVKVFPLTDPTQPFSISIRVNANGQIYQLDNARPDQLGKEPNADPTILA